MDYEEAVSHVDAIEARAEGWQDSMKALRTLNNSSVNEGLRGFEEALGGATFGGLTSRDVEARELERVRSALQHCTSDAKSGDAP